MLSLPSLVPFPTASVMATPRRLPFPVPAAKHETLRATKRVAALQKDDEKLNNGTAVVGEVELPAGLRRELMPKHVALILDGNRRWAQQRCLSASKGHEAGADAVMQIAEQCANFGIKVVTVFAFSTENWDRPEEEVFSLMNVLKDTLKSKLPAFERLSFRVSIIGNRSKIAKPLLNAINMVEEATENNSRGHLIIAVDYSGRFDILQACKSINQKAKEGLIQVEDISESLMEQELETKCTEFPYPDLMIRTSGELRLSNFLLWQLAYAELYFSQVLWPDFKKDELVEALISFQKKERRLG